MLGYSYDATGVKLRKAVNETTITDYAGNFIYENGKLKLLSHPEGYAEPPVLSAKKHPPYKYVYQYKDHLGNIRLSYRDNNGTLEILEENNYYPFGLEHKGYNGNVSANANSVASRFKYNGMELEKSLGIDWYEMDMRQYDPAIARWTSIDPIVHFGYSTYSAFDNNPVFWADPSGANAESDLDAWSEQKQAEIDAIENGASLSDVWGINRLMNSRPAPKGNKSENNDKKPNPYKEYFQKNLYDVQIALYGRKQYDSNLEAFGAGFTEGLKSTGDFILSLGTKKGLKDFGESFLDLFQMGNLMSREGRYKRMNGSIAVQRYINNMPNMTSSDIWYDVGYVTEKGFEAAILSRGVGAAKYVRNIQNISRGFSRAKTGDLMFSFGIRNRLTNWQFRFERGSFNSYTGTPIFTTHLNYGLGGKRHLFFNLAKRKKIKL